MTLLTWPSNYICGLLSQYDISRLSQARKAIYQLIRPILYRHLKITSFASLVLFQRTITQATYMGKMDHKWSTQECLDQTKTLHLTIDPVNDSAPAAVLVSKMLQAIERRCPNLAIILSLEHCQCDATPVSVLINETFPRVTKVIVYVGRHDPDEPLDPQERQRRKQTPCVPNANFWKPFVNGMCFPDCKDIEVRHFWATAPPVNATLDLTMTPEITEMNNGSFGGQTSYRHRYGRRGVSTGLHTADVPQIGMTNGVRKFERVVLECPPELNSGLLMQLLGNPNSVASGLTSLELRFCNLDTETISKLLYHAPPNLKHLVLLCVDGSDTYHGFAPQEGPHLCPLIREFSKNLVHLEFAASTVCRELFFDDLERETLRQNGVTTGLGTSGGAIEGSERLDAHAVRETVLACRKSKRTRYRSIRIKEAINAAKEKVKCEAAPSSLFGGVVNPNASASKAQRETEALLDEEEERRSRLIAGSKKPWFRRIIAWEGLCYAADTWAEIELAVELEEEGVEWVIVSE